MLFSIIELTNSIPAGDGITVNLLFLNPYLWRFQFPQCIAMRKEGYPIEGITSEYINIMLIVFKCMFTHHHVCCVLWF